jgi:hypothetical protein
VVLGIAVWYAYAAEQTTAPATAPAAAAAPAPGQPGEGMRGPRGGGPGGPGGPGRGMGGPMNEERMKAAGMTDGEIMKHKMMNNAKFNNTEPIGLLALKDDLKLTDDQVKKLEAIKEKAAKDAKEVLTADQSATIAKMSGADNVMEMNRDMMTKMREMRGAGGEGGPGGQGGPGAPAAPAAKPMEKPMEPAK